jgi:hypothetical protein
MAVEEAGITVVARKGGSQQGNDASLTITQA